jgi:hypothetical protein
MADIKEPPERGRFSFDDSPLAIDDRPINSAGRAAGVGLRSGLPYFSTWPDESCRLMRLLLVDASQALVGFGCDIKGVSQAVIAGKPAPTSPMVLLDCVNDPKTCGSGLARDSGLPVTSKVSVRPSSLASPQVRRHYLIV